MKTYVRKSRRLEKGTYMITKYTTGEYLFLNIVKLIFFVLILWPVEIVFFKEDSSRIFFQLHGTKITLWCGDRSDELLL